MKKKKLILYFIIIFLLSVGWHVYEESSYFLETPRRLRHILKGFLICIISLVGYIPFSNFKVAWPIKIWTLAHIILIAIVVVIGLVDWWVGGTSFNLRNLADGIYHFIISPIPFLIIVFLSYTFNIKMQKNKV